MFSPFRAVFRCSDDGYRTQNGFPFCLFVCFFSDPNYLITTEFSHSEEKKEKEKST